MSAAEKKELREALPDTQIIFTGQPTENGWRTIPKTKKNHPHYAVIYEMFHTGTYIPFEESAPLPVEEDASDQVFLITEDLEDLDFPDGN